MLHISVTSETGLLKSVVVGYADNFLQVEPEIINETQKKTYFGDNPPNPALVAKQVNDFAGILQSLGVTVYRPKPLSYLPDQIMTRDIGVVIGNTLIITSMEAESRRKEWRAISYLFDQFDNQCEIFVAPEDFVLEGGDIIVDKGKVFIGIGQRTTQAGVDYLINHFPEFNIVPVPLTSLSQGEDVLHLDCSFVPVGQHHALIYPNGLQAVPPEIRDNYKLIEVTRAEQQSLGTNVFSVSPDTVISRPNSARINEAMRAVGLNVIETPYSEPPKTGGSFRCSTLPLQPS
jgi:N-dimethylarginine dimethylaminohydrolase